MSLSSDAPECRLMYKTGFQRLSDIEAAIWLKMVLIPTKLKSQSLSCRRCLAQAEMWRPAQLLAGHGRYCGGRIR